MPTKKPHAVLSAFARFVPQQSPRRCDLPFAAAEQGPAPHRRRHLTSRATSPAAGSFNCSTWRNGGQVAPARQARSAWGTGTEAPCSLRSVRLPPAVPVGLDRSTGTRLDGLVGSAGTVLKDVFPHRTDSRCRSTTAQTRLGPNHQRARRSGRQGREWSGGRRKSRRVDARPRRPAAGIDVAAAPRRPAVRGRRSQRWSALTRPRHGAADHVGYSSACAGCKVEAITPWPLRIMAGCTKRHSPKHPADDCRVTEPTRKGLSCVWSGAVRDGDFCRQAVATPSHGRSSDHEDNDHGYPRRRFARTSFRLDDRHRMV